MSITKSIFGATPCGKEVEEYTLTNKNGMTLQVITYGIRVHKLLTKDKDGNLADVVLGYDKLEDYFGGDYQGTFVGRYANRIAGAKFTVNGVTYNLDKNDGENSLHGGTKGYHQVVWGVVDVKDCEEPSITFTHTSPDGDENYPGTLTITAKYTLTNNDEFKTEYTAISDKDTPFNPTNHSFFNLSGDHSKEIFDVELKINATQFTPVSDILIPTGELAPVAGTSLDFTTAKNLGKDMFAKDCLIDVCGGFDHNFCIDGTGMRVHAEAYDPSTGRTLTVSSDMPGMQLYTCNAAPDMIGKGGIKMVDRSAFCLETQYYPDSPNKPSFPFEFLKANVPFETSTIFAFSAK